MQTFLPLFDFLSSLEVLDDRRLGKQRVEAFQILNILLYEKYSTWLKTPAKQLAPGKRPAWSNHPAVNMWRGCEEALAAYYNQSILSWVDRGFNNTMQLYTHRGPVILPSWLEDDAFHASHRSNLLRKDHTFYSQYGWNERSDLPYVWPVHS